MCSLLSSIHQPLPPPLFFYMFITCDLLLQKYFFSLEKRLMFVTATLIYNTEELFANILLKPHYIIIVVLLFLSQNTSLKMTVNPRRLWSQIIRHVLFMIQVLNYIDAKCN